MGLLMASNAVGRIVAPFMEARTAWLPLAGAAGLLGYGLIKALYIARDRFVVGGRTGTGVHRAHAAASIPARASFVRPTNGGATDTVFNPRAISAGKWIGSPPMSPQRLTSRPSSRPTLTT